MNTAQLYKQREQFIRLAKALIARQYPYLPQRRAIAAKMYANWITRNAKNTTKEETKPKGGKARERVRGGLRILHKWRHD